MAKTFNIECYWSMGGSYQIEAETEAQAREKANNLPLPQDDFYIDGSFEIDSVNEEAATHGD